MSVERMDRQSHRKYVWKCYRTFLLCLVRRKIPLSKDMQKYIFINMYLKDCIIVRKETYYPDLCTLYSSNYRKIANLFHPKARKEITEKLKILMLATWEEHSHKEYTGILFLLIGKCGAGVSRIMDYNVSSQARMKRINGWLTSFWVNYKIDLTQLKAEI